MTSVTRNILPGKDSSMTSRPRGLSPYARKAQEWKPRGASEYILIDQMTQSYVMQIEWTEVAMTRAQGEPRTESYEFRQWAEQRKVEAKYNHWNPGHWDVPYQEEAEAIEQAFRMADLCK
jgi:hypothetical protein